MLDFGSGVLFGPGKVQVDLKKWKLIFFIADSDSGFLKKSTWILLGPKQVPGSSCQMQKKYLKPESTMKNMGFYLEN